MWFSLLGSSPKKIYEIPIGVCEEEEEEDESSKDSDSESDLSSC